MPGVARSFIFIRLVLVAMRKGEREETKDGRGAVAVAAETKKTLRRATPRLRTFQIRAFRTTRDARVSQRDRHTRLHASHTALRKQPFTMSSLQHAESTRVTNSLDIRLQATRRHGYERTINSGCSPVPFLPISVERETPCPHGACEYVSRDHMCARPSSHDMRSGARRRVAVQLRLRGSMPRMPSRRRARRSKKQSISNQAF